MDPGLIESGSNPDSGSDLKHCSQTRTSSTSKHEISELFSVFVGHFCPPRSGYGSTDLIESGSNPDSDPKHCLQPSNENIQHFKT
jgi:hypothetical protein